VEAAGLGHLVVVGAGLGDPQVEVAAARLGHLAQSGVEQVGAHGAGEVPVMGVDHDLHRPGVVTTLAPAHLGVAHRVGMARLPGDEPGEAGATPLDQVEPLVLAEGPVVVGDRGHVEEGGDGGDVGFAHAPFDFEADHVPRR
jgi:hypothetical protein